MILKRNGKWIRKPCFPDQELRESVKRAESVWTMLWVLVKYIIALLVLTMLVTHVHADEMRCYDFSQKVIKAQSLQLTDKRPLVIVQSQFMRTTPGNRDDAKIAWAFALTHQRADFRLLSQDASAQCESMGFGYMYAVYVGDGL